MERICKNGKSMLNLKRIIFVAIMVILLISTLNTVKAASSDTSLKSLTITPSGTGLVQDEENNKVYRVKVNNNVTSITVNAVPNNSNAQVSVSGNTGLQIGTNKVEVTVTAEDGTSTTYIIYVRRADTSIAEENIVPNVQDEPYEEDNEEPENITVEENIISGETTNEITNNISDEIQNSENVNNINNVENQILDIEQNAENIATSATKESNNTYLYALIAIIIVIIVVVIIKKK